MLVWRSNFHFLIQDTVIYQNNCLSINILFYLHILHQHGSINLIKIMICRLTLFTIFSQYLTVASRYLKGGRDGGSTLPFYFLASAIDIHFVDSFL